MFPNPFLNFPLLIPQLQQKHSLTTKQHTPLNNQYKLPQQPAIPRHKSGRASLLSKIFKTPVNNIPAKNHHTPPINIYSPNNQQCPDISLGERQLLSKIFKKPIKNRKVNIHQTPRYHLFSILVSLINKLIPK